MHSIPSLSDIKRAHQRIASYILDTPVMTSHSIDEIAGCTLYFKCENFQKTGSFKMRGASNFIFQFRPEERENGFATHSSGNHAQAVAVAARLAGSKAYVVMPSNSTPVKITAAKSYGAEVVFCDPSEKSRKQVCDKLIAEQQAIFVPPFDDHRIITGQATAAKELIEAQEDLDIIMTPVGGGGLAAGTALAANYLDPNMKVILAEPLGADDTYQSLQAGKIMPLKKPATIADGLRTTIGQKNFNIISKYVEEVITVSEEGIVQAMRMIWERMKIIVEPSCAVPLAAVLQEPGRFERKKVGIILTGGNVDLDHLPFSDK